MFFYSEFDRANWRPDPYLRQLSIGRVIVKTYGRYDVNGFRFRTTNFEATRPLAATKNNGVIIRAADVEGHEIEYYGIINKILECQFAGNKDLRVVFFECTWFDPKQYRTEFGITQVLTYLVDRH